MLSIEQIVTPSGNEVHYQTRSIKFGRDLVHNIKFKARCKFKNKIELAEANGRLSTCSKPLKVHENSVKRATPVIKEGLLKSLEASLRIRRLNNKISENLSK